MKAFTKHTGTLAIINRENIDTDQIISKEHLKSIKRTGYEKALFSDWRYLDDGKPNPAFELNLPQYAKATILVAGNNFGCGSSREHAVWAIVQYGFAVVIAPRIQRNGNTIPGFADIFRNNSSKNGLLTIELSQEEVSKIIQIVSHKQDAQATIDLSEQSITFNTEKPQIFSFKIDAGTKNKLLEGLDDIGRTEKFVEEISAFEAKHNPYL